MELKGSCHCGAVRFNVDYPTPYPYQACYCSICRKTAGGGGYAINLGADSTSLQVEGEENIRSFHARVHNPEEEGTRTSLASRHFCSRCGSALWLYDPRWPELVHPHSPRPSTPRCPNRPRWCVSCWSSPRRGVRSLRRGKVIGTSAAIPTSP